MSQTQIVLQPRRAKPFYARHPWVFPGAIATTQGEPKDGDAVEVYSHGGAFVAHGLFNSKSRLRVRLYSWDYAQPLDEAFFRDRIEKAVKFRRDVLGWMKPGQACRLIFSESDGLSGLTVDYFNGYLVTQFTSLGLAQRKEMLVKLLVEATHCDGIYLRTERGIGEQEGLELQDGRLWGAAPPAQIQIEEAGVTFAANIAEGQKTGFYVDQRQNHQTVAKYAKGRRMLDAFCYSGGFGLHAAQAGATEVIGVDGSEGALALAKENAKLNSVSDKMRFEHEDVFKYLEGAVQQHQKFGMIVLDPPKFARHQSAVDTALRGYRRLLALSLQLLEPEGVLVLCCCSGLITSQQLEEVAAQVATEAKRPLQILEKHGQPPDHPVSLACLETAYLKCLIFRG